MKNKLILFSLLLAFIPVKLFSQKHFRFTDDDKLVNEKRTYEKIQSEFRNWAQILDKISYESSNWEYISEENEKFSYGGQSIVNNYMYYIDNSNISIDTVDYIHYSFPNQHTFKKSELEITNNNPKYLRVLFFYKTNN